MEKKKFYGRYPADVVKILKETDSRELLEKTPLRWKNGNGKILTALFAPEKDSIIAANSAYVDVFSACGRLYGAGEKDMIFAGRDGSDIFAAFLPCRMLPEFKAAASVVFKKAPAAAEAAAADPAALQDMQEKIDILQAANSTLQARAAAAEAAAAAAEAAAAEAEARAAAAIPAAADPAAGAEAAAEAFRIIPGATVTIKGAATASPVIWIVGGDAAAVKSAGARWSDKKQAFYFKVS